VRLEGDDGNARDGAPAQIRQGGRLCLLYL
jgi:hypothetical protein